MSSEAGGDHLVTVAPSTASLDVLPRELLYLIFKLLRPIDVLRLRRVSKRWAQISRDDMIWLPFVSRILPNAAKLRSNKLLPGVDLSELYCRSQFCPFTSDTIARYRKWFDLAKTESSLRQPIKIVAVGTGAVGKTCLLNTFIHGVFPHQYAPIIADSTSVTLSSYRGTKRSLLLWDIPVSAGYALNNRIKSYSDTDMFLLCYSIADLASFEDIEAKWIPELQMHCPHAPYMLVGLKTDLRENRETAERMRLWYGRDETLTREEGQLFACKIGAKYLECSALEGSGVHEVFIAAAHLIWLLRCFGKEDTSDEDLTAPADRNQLWQLHSSTAASSSGSFSSAQVLSTNTAEEDEDALINNNTSSSSSSLSNSQHSINVNSSNSNNINTKVRSSTGGGMSRTFTLASSSSSSRNNSPFRSRSANDLSAGCIVQ